MKKSYISFIFLTLFLVSSFIIPKKVFADTFDVTLSEDPLTYITNDFFTIKNYSDNYITSQTTYKYYFISYENGVYKSTFIYDNSSNGTLTLSYSDRHLKASYYISTSYKRVKLENGSIVTDLESTGIPYTDYWCTRTTNCHYILLDTNIPILTTNNNTINLIYESTTYSFVNTFKTVYQLYRDLYPEDTMPLLTQFFTLFIEKLVLVTEYFSSNYIYLSIFAVFLIYFVILLIRRLK